LAAEWIKKEIVLVGGEACKPSRIVKVGEELSIRKAGVVYSYRVIGMPHSRVGAPKVKEYMVDQTNPEELEKLEFMRMMRSIQRDRGTGRPTKKDRRDIDKIQDGDWPSDGE
jgi:ribosome-associated heat shock protein Hsp15